MGYPQRLLGADEQVLLDLRPHWRRLVLPVLVLVAVVGLASFGLASVPRGSAQGAERLVIAMLAAGLLAAFVLVPWLRWLTTHYVVTTDRVVLRRGVLSRSGRDIPLSRLNDVTFDRTLAERMLGSGSLSLESAGEHGQVVLADVGHVEEVQRTLYLLMEEDRDGRPAHP